YQRITAESADDRMPPQESGKSLSAAEIAKLKMWIEEGAVYEGHWAFLPPVRPPLPVVKNRAWCRNPIDYFVLAKLESSGLDPSPEADRATIVKRLSLDLTGLLPSFDRAVSPSDAGGDDSLEQVIDRLLGSPHHGERWGRVWLDAARYADSDG